MLKTNVWDGSYCNIDACSLVLERFALPLLSIQPLLSFFKRSLPTPHSCSNPESAAAIQCSARDGAGASRCIRFSCAAASGLANRTALLCTAQSATAPRLALSSVSVHTSPRAPRTSGRRCRAASVACVSASHGTAGAAAADALKKISGAQIQRANGFIMAACDQ
jgi:hypothetical protein